MTQAFEGKWLDHSAVNPTATLEGEPVTPAPNREAASTSYDLIEADAPRDAHIKEAREYIQMLPNNAGEQAGVATTLLRDAGPDSTPYTRALIGELVSQSKSVRDACMVEMLGDNPPALNNLTYVARSSNEQHRAQISSLAAACHYFDGDQTAVDTFAERSQDTTLGQLLITARQLGMPPTPEMKSAIRASAVEEASKPANPNQPPTPVAKPERTHHPRTSVDGVDPLSGPSAGPGIGGVGI